MIKELFTWRQSNVDNVKNLELYLVFVNVFQKPSSQKKNKKYTSTYRRRFLKSFSYFGQATSLWTNLFPYHHFYARLIFSAFIQLLMIKQFFETIILPTHDTWVRLQKPLPLIHLLNLTGSGSILFIKLKDFQIKDSK